ncbi:MAG TPA: hydrogenase formation protein HypD [Actinomycetota bacterium]
MRFVDEFRDAEKAQALSGQIAALCEPGRHYSFMEVCGGHTHTIYKHGLEDYLPESVSLVHGPGCPVCVIPMGRLDDAIYIAEQPDVIMTSFGDMMRVPGGKGSFFDSKAKGADIRMVYSPLDSLKIARENPDKRVVFMAIGFETTAPSTAMTVLRAAADGLENFSIFCNHVTIIPAIKAILDSPDMRLDGFLGPGHVSTVIGCKPYEFIARDHNKPLVCAGFEPLDILASIYQLMIQLRDGRCEVENQYTRVVPWDGNLKALQVINEVMELRPYFEWRGLGFISHSALKVRPAYAKFDAEEIFKIPGIRVADPKACQCGEVLKGVIKPWECKVFGTACTPETPIGTCMVSPEGACAAYYNFGRFTRDRVKEATRA